MSKVSFQYDGIGSAQNQGTPVQHDDTNFGYGFVAGRGNLSSITRYDVTNLLPPITTSAVYNTAGSVISTTDGAAHTISISYTDAFSPDGTNSTDPGYVTLAYATTLTDADGYSSHIKYHYDIGAQTRTEGPPPAGQSQGAIQTITYNGAARVSQVTTVNNGAYVHFFYGPNYAYSFATVNNVADEAYSIQFFDGLGRPYYSSSNHPGSSGGYKGLTTVFDLMGRVWKQSNPTEVNSSSSPSGDDAAGWLYTTQTYDWKGRPLVTTNPDLTTKSASYSVCDCAGNGVATFTDEGTIDNGVTKHRQQKVYQDTLGRVVKTEIYNWQETSIYSSIVYTPNALDQETLVRQFQGVAPSSPNDLSCPTSTCQQATATFDGYGRLKTKHVPEQQPDANNQI